MRSAAFALLLACAVPFQAMAQADGSATVPLGKVPTVEGGGDGGAVTVPPPAASDAKAPPAALDALPPAEMGTLSSWRAKTDRASIRLAADLPADQLLDAPVADSGGKPLGTIDDLLIDTDGMVRKALLRQEAGGSPTIIDLTQLSRAQSGAGFVLTQP